jgi:hypothetical protein
MKSVLLSAVLLFSFACRSTPEDTEDTGLPQDTGDTDLPIDTGDPLPENVYQVTEDLRWDEDITIGTIWMIPEGITLTIAQGVTVSFLPGAGIMVDGSLLSEGTTENPVRFVSSNQITTGNYGVSVGGGADNSRLDGTVFESINLRLEGRATASISDASFSDSTLTLLSRDTPFSVQNCQFAENRRDNQAALYVRDLAELSVSDSSFVGVGNGISYNGTPDSAVLTVSNSVFHEVSRAIEAGNVLKSPHTVSLSGITVENSSTHAIALYGSDAQLENVSITQSLGYGVYADAESSINWTGGSVQNTQATGIYSAGSLNLVNVMVSDSDSHGIFGGEEGTTLTNVMVSDIEGYGVYAYGALTVIDSSFDQVRSSGIYSAYGNAFVSGTEVSNVLGHGIYAIYGDLTVENVNVHDVEGQALYTNTGNLTATGTTVMRARGYGIYAYRGDVSVTDVIVSEIENSGIFSNDGSIVAQNVTVDGVRGIGLYANYGGINLTDVSVLNTVSHAVYAKRGDIVAHPGTTGVLIEDTDGTGLYANTGNVYASSVEINRARNHGIYSSYGNVSVTGSTVTEVGQTSVYAYYGDLSLDNSTLQGFTQNGVYVYQGNANISNVVFEETGDRGIYVNVGDLTLDNTNISGTNYQAIYLTNGDASLTDVTVSDTGDIGVYLAKGDVTVDRLRIVDLDGDGLSSTSVGLYVKNGKVEATDLLVDKAGSYGVYAMNGDLSDCTLSNNLHSGVYFFGFEQASTVEACEFRGNATYGVQGRSNGENSINVIESNIQINANYGVHYIRLLESSFVEDNKGQSGVDLTEQGSLDGSLDVTTSQLSKVDAIVTPASTKHEGIGSSLSAI